MVGVDNALLNGRYRLVERLGAGGMSVVWRGYDEVLGRQVAVKVLAARLASDRAFRHRIRTEAQAAARLVHPHITNVYDYGESVIGGVTVPYVVMELVDGHSLQQRLGKGEALPWPEAVTAGAQIAAALSAAHARGVVHRDVTPANVMLTPGGAKVVDFGISALVGERDAGPDGSLLGTPAYVAPERLDGGHVSGAADVYALGLILYRALTGRLPWPATGKTDLLRSHLYREPEPLPPIDGLPAPVAEIIARSVVKDPAARPTSHEVAEVLGAALVTAGPVRPVSPAPAGIVPLAEAGTTFLPWSSSTDTMPWSVAAARRSGRPRGRRLEAVGIATALLVATGIVWAVTGRTPPEGAGAVAAGIEPAAAADAPSCAVTYALTRDTGKAFDAKITIVNADSDPLRDWSLTFTYPGDQKVTRAGAAAVAQDGAAVVLRPTGPSTTIAAGRSADLTLSGGYTRSNAFPVAFSLDGAACEPSLSGVTTTVAQPAVKPEPKPAAPKPAAAAPKPPKKDSDNSGPGSANSGKGKGDDDDHEDDD